MNETLPEESDFVVYGDLDEQSACRSFLGKTTTEVEEMLRGDFLRYQEDFMFMAPKAFCFYFKAMSAVMRSDFDPENAHMLALLCEYRLSDPMALEMRCCSEEVAECLQRIASEYPESLQNERDFARATAGRYRAMDRAG